MDQREQDIMQCLFPHAFGERKRMITNGVRLAHYAAADTATNILTNQEFWLRDSRCMNDFKEVHHGLGLLEGFFADRVKRAAFLDAVNSIHDGVGQEVVLKFYDWKSRLWAGTYILCMSEHHSPKDDKYGRLSMWRAYGRAAGGAAIVMNIPMDQGNADFNVFLSPVAYRDNIDEEMNTILSNIGNEKALLSTIPRNEFLNRLFSMLVMAAVCLKHPGFEEEKEWRLVYLPYTYHSGYVEEANETIGGVPQTVYKLKFSEAVRAGHIGASPSNLIYRVIIGPTAYPATISDQVYKALAKLGFANPQDHMWISYIPLRM